MSFLDSYEKARMKLKRSEEESDLQTDEMCSEERTQRKRR